MNKHKNKSFEYEEEFDYTNRRSFEEGNSFIYYIKQKKAPFPIIIIMAQTKTKINFPIESLSSEWKQKIIKQKKNCKSC